MSECVWEGGGGDSVITSTEQVSDKGAGKWR